MSKESSTRTDRQARATSKLVALACLSLPLTATSCASAPETKHPPTLLPQEGAAKMTPDEGSKVRRQVAKPLAAGLYFRDGHYEWRACRDCPAPTWAVVAGVSQDLTRANATIDEAYNMEPSLPAGYPWAVHTRDIQFEDADIQGIAIVTGLFLNKPDALAWLEQHDQQNHWHIEKLATKEVALERLHANLMDSERLEKDAFVFQLEYDARQRPVPAYKPSDLDGVFDKINARSWDSFEEYEAMRDQFTAELTPSCELPAGELFLTTGYDDINRFQRMFLPVQCQDGELANVPLSATRHQTVVSKIDEDTARLIQVTLVECDVATFEEWRYTNALGRRAPTEDETRIALDSSGCGEP